MIITNTTPIAYSQGFSLCEIFVSMVILVIGILSVTKMQLLAIHNDEDAYLYSVAENQLQAVVERISLGVPSAGELQQWNKENVQVLPQAVGQIKGQSPYTITLNWIGREVKSKYHISIVVPSGF
ncbi:hypothetical protein BH10PSE19_BH10PSE19_03910 [soil metagenome]